ncbi:chaplin [Streptomyces sp. RerS4]|uniref:chaplin n=1 Tax=Streptomyces sp. RerS4 TaxID=2942449 RepID=UPI00201BA9C1|nr:chaplin [Streptomyces sp. RerS4]UQX01562.1 chaplin [Streptomyces sp. RerS4]
MRQVLSRQVLGKGVLTAAAASSLLSIATGAVHAQSGAMAEASHSPGVLAGNSVSVPVTFAPNVCGNSVDGGAALNPAFGNTCATTSGSDVDHGYERHLSPEHAEAIGRYLDERRGGGRHALPEQRREQERHYEAPRAHAPRHAAPRHAAPHHDEHGDDSHRGRYGGHGDEERQPQGDEECDDHPPQPEQQPPHAEHPAPLPPAPRPVEEPQPQPLPAPNPLPAPPVQEAPPLPEEQPHPLPAPAPVTPQPAPAPPVVEQPAPHPPHGSQPVEKPAPAPEVDRPADQPPAAPAGDVPADLPRLR